MKKHVGIQSPCSEERSKMVPLENSDFCKKCAMEVQDFSDLSPEEIKLQLYLRMNQSVCARMTVDQERQLNLDFLQWKGSKQDQMRRAMFFLLFIVFGLTLFSCSNQDAKFALTSAHSEFVQSMKMNVEMITNDIAEIEKDSIFVDEDLEFVGDGKELQKIPSRSPEDSLVLIERISSLPEREPMIAGGIGFDREYFNYIEEIHRDTLSNEEMESLENSSLPKYFEASVYPNPTRGHSKLSVDLPSGTEDLRIDILNMGGQIIQTVYSGEINPSLTEFEITLNDQAPGTYLISVKTNNNSQTLRLIKQ